MPTLRLGLGLGLGLGLAKSKPKPKPKLNPNQALLDAVLASCYIPIAYEAPVCIAPHGFCVDGCSLHFLPDADVLISPYHCHLAEISPARQAEPEPQPQPQPQP